MAGNDVADRREFLTCAVCINIFQDPKLLPCHHTFCLKCVQDLISLCPSSSFPCPMCRKQTRVPAGGASAFQDNFYILPQDLERARNWRQCLRHDKVLEFYCDKCQEAICVNCNLTEHKSHPTRDIGQAIQKAREDLEKDKPRLQSAALVLGQRKNKGKEKLASIDKEAQELETLLRKKHARVVRISDQCLRESLSTLQSVVDEVKKTVKSDVSQLRKNVQELCSLLKRVNQSLQDGESCELLTVSREMRYGRGGAQAVRKLTSCLVSDPNMPQVVSRGTDQDVKQQISEYIGVVLHQQSS